MEKGHKGAGPEAKGRKDQWGASRVTAFKMKAKSTNGMQEEEQSGCGCGCGSKNCPCGLYVGWPSHSPCTSLCFLCLLHTLEKRPHEQHSCLPSQGQEGIGEGLHSGRINCSVYSDGLSMAGILRMMNACLNLWTISISWEGSPGFILPDQPLTFSTTGYFLRAFLYCRKVRPWKINWNKMHPKANQEKNTQ